MSIKQKNLFLKIVFILTNNADSDEIPQDWQRAFVALIFKKGEWRHVPSNYRPVSLTPIACKVLKHIVLSSVMRHFDKNQTTVVQSLTVL